MRCPRLKRGSRYSRQDVAVWSDKIKNPKAVRYGWADWITCNLYNTEGLPASPFRTDSKIMESLYVVKKTSAANFKQINWENANTLKLNNYMGAKPEHFPNVQAQLLYDQKNIYVFFKVEDKYVRAVAQKNQDSVCRDSCVEFFFTPGEDISEGYFNLEMNCGGTLLLYHQTARGENRKDFSQEDCEKIQITTSMPKIVEPEITEPTTWTVKYAIPLDLIKKYANVVQPKAGVKWRANFYKCADQTSHPHWLTWEKVNKPKPDFHLPEFFGTLVFE